jgi:hypothetical protein
VSWAKVTTAVTAVVFLGLVAIGVEYVVHSSSEQASLAGTSPQRSSAPPTSTSSQTASPTPTPLPSSTPTPSGSAAPSPSLAPPATSATSSTSATGLTPTAEPSSSTPTPAPPPTLDFTLTTFNVLGASHTARGGTHHGFASGRARANGAAALIAKHRSDVVGFQELQGPQLAALQRSTKLEFYPGFSMGHLDTDNSIGWRRDEWTAVEEHVIRIPYFNGGRRAMPVVRLRNDRTGLEAWFANFHNPAETSQFHHQQRFRVAATNIEAALANQLISTGLPVFITGDMNERAAYFCRLTAKAPMVAARGGSNNGRCLVGRPRAVDWIFGSQGVTFSGYVEDRSHLVDVTTDHPVVSARVRITGNAKNPGLLGGILGGGSDD